MPHFDACRYEPRATAAIILTGLEPNQDEEEAIEACKEAEISLVIRQSEPREPQKYISNVNQVS